jgi:hypothetical protein
VRLKRVTVSNLLMQRASSCDQNRATAMTGIHNKFQASAVSYLAAVIGASATIFFTLFARIPPQPFVPFRPELLVTFTEMFFVLSFFVFAMTLLAFTIVVVLAERFHIDDAVYYVGCGAVTGAAAIAGFIQNWTALLDIGPYFIAGGAIGGLVHWFVAGRHAGAGCK